MTIELFDTTLRDGAQAEGVSFSCDDKLQIAARLDALGVDFIEGGWPGSNPKDMEFFERAARELSLRRARLTAFGSTCRRDTAPEADQQIELLLQANTPVISLFGKSWDLHVRDVLQTSKEENLRMIRASIAHLTGRGKEVIYDAEHFFDGFIRIIAAYALATLREADSRRGILHRLVRYQRRQPGLGRSAKLWQRFTAVCLLEIGQLSNNGSNGKAARLSGSRKRCTRHPRAQRQRLGRRQLARCGPQRLHARSGHGKRLRRTLRQRKPRQRHRQPAAEDGIRLGFRGKAGVTDRPQPLRQ